MDKNKLINAFVYFFVMAGPMHLAIVLALMGLIPAWWILLGGVWVVLFLLGTIAITHFNKNSHLMWE